MGMQEKSSKFGYVVEPFMEDFTGKLAWHELGNRILAAAGKHADSHGFGMKQLLQQNLAWVLSRMNVEMQEMPKVNEHYYIETWIRSIYRTFTDRCFAITRPDSSVLGYAYTTWALINTETRMPVNLENLPGGGFSEWVDAEKKCDVAPFSRIRVKSCEPERVVTAYYNDIDINQHVNSIRYIEHILDLFSIEELSERSIAGVEIAYHGEAHYGDRLAFFRQGISENVYDVDVQIISDEAGVAAYKKACSCRVTFK